MKTKGVCLLIAGIILLAVGLSARSSLFSLVKDMMNQVSIKPQEEGGVLKIPTGTVTTDGILNEDPTRRFDWSDETADENRGTPPIRSDASIAAGRKSFERFCIFCHGDSKEISNQGLAKTRMNEKGMVAPALITLTPHFNDRYIYNRIKYGGTIMPPLGDAVAESERWGIVLYIRELEKTDG